MASSSSVTMNGSIAYIDVAYPYQEQSEVEVRLNGVLKALGTDYTWTTSTRITFNSTPVNGTLATTQRVTDTDPKVQFQPGNLDPLDINTAVLQAIYVGEEARDLLSAAVSKAWTTAGGGAGKTISPTAGAFATFDSGGNLTGSDVDATTLAEAEANADQVAADKATVVSTKAQIDIIYAQLMALDFNTAIDTYLKGLTHKTTPLMADRVHLGDTAAANGAKYSTVTEVFTQAFQSGNKWDSVYLKDTSRFVDSTDTSKAIKLDASGITTGTTRTLKMANVNVDLGALIAKLGVDCAFIFDGTGTTSVIAGVNLGSLTDLGVGNWRSAFTTQPPTANYVVTGTGRAAAADNIAGAVLVPDQTFLSGSWTDITPTTSQFSFHYFTPGNSNAFDVKRGHVAVTFLGV